MLEDFAVFILSHGRPDKVITLNTLKRQGYTGDYYIIIDNEDKTADKYYKNFGDKVIIFDKAAIAETFDEGDNFGDRRAVVYARNACFQIARDLGITYFMELDDDYNDLRYKTDSQFNSIHRAGVKNPNRVIELLLDYYKMINAKSIATLQGGDFFAGGDSFGKSKRKCMNTFFCSTERPFEFVGKINEDVNTYTWFQSLGNLFLSIPFIQVDQLQTQGSSGGMTDLYLDSGTYVKSFYTVMYSPSCTKIGIMGEVHKRLHHQISWDNAVPAIISERYRKNYTGKEASRAMP